MARFVEIAVGSAEPEVVPLNGPSVLGAGPNADLVVGGAEELAPAHLSIDPEEGGCRVTIERGAPTPILVEGIQHDDGVLPWGAELTVGRVRVRLLAEREQATRRSPILLLAPVVLGLALWLLTDDDAGAPIPEAPAPPEILAELPGSCESGDANTFHLAEREEAAARAREQRYPFDARDGVPAVQRYERARLCFDASGHGSDAARVTRGVARMRRRVETDYDTARFRLSRALSSEDYPSAIREAELLLALLQGRDDPYVDWLILLERRLRLAVARASRESS